MVTQTKGQDPLRYTFPINLVPLFTERGLGGVATIKTYFLSNFFDKDLPFSYRLSSIFYFEALILSMLSFTMNVLLGASNAGIFIQGGVNLLFIAFLFIPLTLKQRTIKALLFFIIYLYLPFMFVQYGGYEGSVLYFVVVGIFLLSFLFDGKMRVALVSANIAMYVALIVLQANFPWLVTPMANPDAKVADLLAALVFTMVGMFILVRYVNRAYESERLRNIYLLNEVENKKSELEELSIKDGLTGIFNRRYLTEASEQILIRSANEGRGACVIMFDIDFFKKVNDTYGHTVGDEVLIAVVNAAQAQLRKNDIIARYGGEEFIIVLYPETLENAVHIAERIRLAVERLILAEGLKVTVSLGVTESMPGEGVDSLFQRVDEYLYQAKNGGRNQVASSLVKKAG